MEALKDKLLKAVVIDDEAGSRQLIGGLLTNYCEGIEIVGEAASARQGVEVIRNENPDVVFLDIEMPQENGFNLLDAFDPPLFKVVFITGHDEYAIKAIKYSALDYLLKPIQLPELKAAIEAARNDISQNRQLELFRELFKNEQRTRRIALPGSREYHVVSFENIIKLKSHENYVTFHMKGEKEYMASHHLQHYASLLPEETFFRIHRSCIINLDHVVKYEKGKGGDLQLTDGSIETVSYRRKAAFIKAMRFLNKA